MWLLGIEGDKLRELINDSPAMYMFSLPDGKILWANKAFCQWSCYTLSELTAMSWIELSEKDKDLVADIEAATHLQETRSYRIQKRYRPKGAKAQIGTLDVQAYPETGEIEYCRCCWIPFVNGTAEAFELAMSSQEKVFTKLNQIDNTLVTLQQRTEEETFLLGAVRMAQKYPKLTGAMLIILLALAGLDGVLSTLQRLGVVQSPVMKVD